MKRLTKRQRNLREEMLLAKMIAETEAARIKGIVGQDFLLDNDLRPVAACAIGALALVRRKGDVNRARLDSWGDTTKAFQLRSERVWLGNDNDIWGEGPNDQGESLGWAYRNAKETP